MIQTRQQSFRRRKVTAEYGTNDSADWQHDNNSNDIPSARVPQEKESMAQAVAEEKGDVYWEFPSQTNDMNVEVAALQLELDTSDAARIEATHKDGFTQDRAIIATRADAGAASEAAAVAFTQHCLNLLDTYSSGNNRVSEEEYVEFLQALSQGTFQAQTFTALPLFLSMIFFSASCSSGEDCISQPPQLTLQQQEAAAKGQQDRNVVLCNQLMRYPFLEILFPFQFLIRVPNRFTAADVLAPDTNDNNRNGGIVRNLEAALDYSLLDGFNCSDTVADVAKPRGKKQHLIAAESRQPQSQNDCNYIVDVTIADATDYPCGFQSSCILIFSDVSVYAVLDESLDGLTLQRTTTNLLRQTINGDILEEFLSI